MQRELRAAKVLQQICLYMVNKRMPMAPSSALSSFCSTTWTNLNMMQRELRAAKDVASCSAAQAAGAEASQQDLQHLQVCLPVLTPCLVFYLPDTAAGMLPVLTSCLIAYVPDTCRYVSCARSLSYSLSSSQLQVCFLCSLPVLFLIYQTASGMFHVTIQWYTDLSLGP